MAARGRPATITSLDFAGRTPSSRPAPRTVDGGDPAETARYVAQLSGELADMARAARLDVLAYILDMARAEAGNAVRADTRP